MVCVCVFLLWDIVVKYNRKIYHFLGSWLNIFPKYYCQTYKNIHGASGYKGTKSIKFALFYLLGICQKYHNRKVTLIYRILI